MYANTQAYLRLKEQTQEILDFTVLISNSVPLLKMTIKKIEKGVDGIQLANPDYFKGDQNQEQLKSYAAEYKNNLSKYLLISNFSYFEAYVLDAIKEMIEFHGGPAQLIDATRKRCQKHIDPTDDAIVNSRKKLQDSYKRKNDGKYQKFTKLLQEKNFKFPSELLTSYGVQKLIDVLENVKSVGIPDLLIDGLHFQMTENDVKEFHRIRDIRNSIAHGKRKGFSMPDAMACNKFLRDLSASVDKHLVNNFFIIERFS